jgi:hypothetical protein
MIPLRMPNWCQNIMEVEGDEEHLKQFIEKADDGKFTLEAYFPMPENPEDHLDDGPPHWTDLLREKGRASSMPDWYEWRVKYWGTKWDVKEEGGTFLMKDKNEPAPISSTTMTIDNGKFAVSYMTAWGPPAEGIREISKRNPTLMFKLIYAEFGHGSAGTVVYLNGLPVSFEEGDPDEYAKRYDFSHAY